MTNKTSSNYDVVTICKKCMQEFFFCAKLRDHKNIVFRNQVLLIGFDPFRVVLLGLQAAIAIGSSSNDIYLTSFSLSTQFDLFMTFEFDSQVVIIATLVFIFFKVKCLRNSALTIKVWR